MKKLVGFLLFLCASFGSLNGKNSELLQKELIEESCVSIAGKLTKDRPDLFRLAYGWCIKQRCGCNI